MAILVTVVSRAFRELRRSPAFALGILLTLALGIGVNALTFGLVDRLLLAGPSGVVDPERVRRVFIDRSSGGDRFTTSTFTYSDYVDLRAAQGLEAVAAETRTKVVLGRGAESETLSAALVTADYFQLLGVTPHYGRFFGRDETERERARVAVLSHAFWLRQFDGDSRVLGRRLELGSGVYTVVGVAQRKFTGSSVERVDLFLPLETAAQEMIGGDWEGSRGIHWIGAIARLGSGVDAEAAEAEATALHRAARADMTRYDPEARILLPKLTRVSGPGVGREIPVALALAGVALLVLLIAGANVANLFQARARRRAHEISIHFALGARRARLLLEQMVEGVLLSLLGALVAVWIAAVGGRVVGEIFLPEVAWAEHGFSATVLAALFVLALLTGGVAAWMPAWIATRAGANPQPSGVGGRYATRRTRTQTLMLLAQTALSVMLLAGAGLFVRSLENARNVDLGLDTRGLFLATMDLGSEPPPERGVELSRQAAERIERLEGVESVALSALTVPFRSNWAIRLKVTGLEERPRVESGGPYIHLVSPGFFETVGLALRRGRTFTDSDRAGAPRVVVINETMARLYWPGQDAIGRCLEIGGGETEDSPPGCTEVVGVVEDAHQWGLDDGDHLLYYVPLAQSPVDTQDVTPAILARAATSDDVVAAELKTAIRGELYALDPGLRSVSARPYDEILAPELRSWRLGASLFSAFGLLALVVAGVGLYSVLTFEVAGRRRELGVRAALGATRDRIVRLVLFDSFKVLAVAVVLGLGGAAALAPLLRSMLFGVQPGDPVALAAAAAILLFAGLLASWVPARRAAAVDPAATLRSE